jgi:hypothetical protein
VEEAHAPGELRQRLVPVLVEPAPHAVATDLYWADVNGVMKLAKP